MSKNNVFIIQLNAVLLLLGYWLMHSVVTLALGQSGRNFSIIYDAFQAAVSVYVLIICRKDFFVESGRSFLSFYSILLVLYSFRMFFDMGLGPFANVIPQSWFINDLLYTVVGTFLTVWAIIASRKWIDINKVVTLVFWMGLVTTLAVIVNLKMQGLSTIYEDERLDAGQGLGTLALVKIGAILVFAAIHLLLNNKNLFIFKAIYIIGVIIGGWLMLASGSRGGVVGTVLALGVYFLASSRRNVFMIGLSVAAIVMVLINIVPILDWVSNYFPVFGQRMLNTILEDDQGSRDSIRADAIRVTLEHPLFGYSYRLYPTQTGFRAHNGILEVFIALGIPMGLVFTYFVYIKGFIMAYKKMIDKRFFFPATFAVFALVSSFTSSSISNNVFCFAICMLGCVYYYQQTQE